MTLFLRGNPGPLITLSVISWHFLLLNIGANGHTTSGITSQFSGFIENGKCQKIDVPLCKGYIPYDIIQLPNIFNHQSQEKVKNAISQYRALIEVQCSPHLREFLCSAYLPQCTESSVSDLPCRSLCNAVKNDCRELMGRLGFDWPEAICDLFPDGDRCFKGNITVQEAAMKTLPEAKCQDINVPICTRFLPYRKAMFANLRVDQNQEDTLVDAKQFIQYTRMSSCNPYMMAFACALRFPVCTETGEVVPPCRSMCTIVKLACSSRLGPGGRDWGDLDCGRFPERGSCFDGSRCQRITIPQCKGYLPSGTVKLPNAFNHGSQREVQLDLQYLDNVIKTQCSPRMRDFICSAYLPECTLSDKIILPCKSLCLAVKKDCEMEVERGFVWTKELDCENFPSQGACFDGNVKQQEFTKEETAIENGQGTKCNCTIEDTDKDKPTDCIHGNYKCRHGSARVFINGETHCCFDEKQISYESSCSRERNYLSSCKCSYPTPKRQGSC